MARKFHESVMRRCGGPVLAAVAALVGSSPVASAADGAAEQRLRDELRVLVASMVRDGAFGDGNARDIALTIEVPTQRVADLGLLVDSAAPSRDGLRVLAVTPGGSAQRMGLRGGDLLLALNGIALSGSKAAAMLRGAVDSLPNGAALSFELRRDGHPRTINGSLSVVELPPMQLRIGDGAAVAADAEPPAPTESAPRGCGRLSEFDVAPRQQGLHAAKIISIDDQTPGPSGSTAFRVAAGHHSITVAERIEPRYLAFNDRLRNSGPRTRYKSLQVDVASDTTLFVAAQLLEDKRNEWRDGAYWEPVVWKTSAEPCR